MSQKEISHFNILHLFTLKPFNFRKNLVQDEDIKQQYESEQTRNDEWNNLIQRDPKQKYLKGAKSIKNIFNNKFLLNFII